MRAGRCGRAGRAPPSGVGVGADLRVLIGRLGSEVLFCNF